MMKTPQLLPTTYFYEQLSIISLGVIFYFFVGLVRICEIDSISCLSEKTVKLFKGLETLKYLAVTLSEWP